MIFGNVQGKLVTTQQMKSVRKMGNGVNHQLRGQSTKKVPELPPAGHEKEYRRFVRQNKKLTSRSSGDRVFIDIYVLIAIKLSHHLISGMI